MAAGWKCPLPPSPSPNPPPSPCLSPPPLCTAWLVEDQEDKEELMNKEELMTLPTPQGTSHCSCLEHCFLLGSMGWWGPRPKVMCHVQCGLHVSSFQFLPEMAEHSKLRVHKVRKRNLWPDLPDLLQGPLTPCLLISSLAMSLHWAQSTRRDALSQQRKQRELLA